MPRIPTIIGTLALLTSAPAFAGDDFAQYGINVGVSPFGGSLNFGYNSSEKNTINIAIGGLPGMEMDLEIDGKDYTVEGSSAWVGAFVNHRPCDNDWFRFVFGLGIGSISNELTDKSGNVYEANYTENPVGYLGLGFGQRPVKGFVYGLDVGWLQKLAHCNVELLSVRYKVALEASKSRRGGTSLGKMFVADVKSLLDELSSTKPHFIRCIKPNMEKVRARPLRSMPLARAPPALPSDGSRAFRAVSASPGGEEIHRLACARAAALFRADGRRQIDAGCVPYA